MLLPYTSSHFHLTQLSENRHHSLPQIGDINIKVYSHQEDTKSIHRTPLTTFSSPVCLPLLPSRHLTEDLSLRDSLSTFQSHCGAQFPSCYPPLLLLSCVVLGRWGEVIRKKVSDYRWECRSVSPPPTDQWLVITNRAPSQGNCVESNGRPAD